MHFVDNVNLVTSVDRRILHLFANIACVVHAVVTCGVHLHNIKVGVARLLAHSTLSARIAVVLLGIGAVDGACKNLRRTRLTRTARACKQISMTYLVVQNLIAQSVDYVVLTDDVVKGLRTVFAVQCNVVHSRLRGSL